MIKIEKKAEPNEWTQYRKTPGAEYQSCDALVQSLLTEQGYICAYCMRRIPQRDKISGKLTQEDHRVEHIQCREKYPHLQLDYKNMVICCPGHIGDENHCDRSKDTNWISFSPLDKHFIDTIKYDAEGQISSINSCYDQEINKVLHLNTPLLVRNRRSALDVVIQMMKQAEKGKPWTTSVLQRYINKYSTMHNYGGKMQYIPYCGIVLYYLNKKLSKCKL